MPIIRMVKIRMFVGCRFSLLSRMYIPWILGQYIKLIAHRPSFDSDEVPFTSRQMLTELELR